MDPMQALTAVLAVLMILAALAVLARGIHVIPPNAQGVMVLLGSYRRTLNPGFNVVSPLARVTIVDLSGQRVVVPPTQFLAPHGSISLTATVNYRVSDAANFVFKAKDGKAELLDLTRASLAEAILGDRSLSKDPRDPAFSNSVLEDVRGKALALGITVESIAILPS